MSSSVRRDIEEMLGDWDALFVQGVRLPCIFDREYVEVLDMSGTFPVARTATHLIQGDDARVLVSVGAEISRIETVDGRRLGPFRVVIDQPDSPGETLLVLEDTS